MIMHRHTRQRNLPQVRASRPPSLYAVTRPSERRAWSVLCGAGPRAGARRRHCRSCRSCRCCRRPLSATMSASGMSNGRRSKRRSRRLRASERESSRSSGSLRLPMALAAKLMASPPSRPAVAARPRARERVPGDWASGFPGLGQLNHSHNTYLHSGGLHTGGTN